MRKENTKFCKPCNSKSHDEVDCWAQCGICGRRNHQTNYCKFKENQANTQTERADKAAAKDKKKKKKTGKNATVNTGGDSKRESEAELDEEASEDDSPKKQNPQENVQRTARSARICYATPSYRDLNEQLSNLSEEERKGFAGSYKAYRARVDRDDDTSVMKSRVYSKMQGGHETDTDSVMDTGCTLPITTTSVAEAIGAEVKPLTESMPQASPWTSSEQSECSLTTKSWGAGSW